MHSTISALNESLLPECSLFRLLQTNINRRPSPAKKLTHSTKLVEKHRQHMKDRASQTTEEDTSLSNTSHSFSKVLEHLCCCSTLKPKMRSLEEATIAGEGGDGEITAGIGAASGEGEYRQNERDNEPDGKPKDKENKKCDPIPRGNSFDSLKLHKKEKSKKSLQSSSNPSSPLCKSQRKVEKNSPGDDVTVKFSARHEREEPSYHKEADENPSELKFSGSKDTRRSSRTKSEESSKEGGAKSNSLSVGKKVKKNTKTLLKKKSPRIDRSHRRSVDAGSGEIIPERGRERRHSLDVKTANPIVKFQEVIGREKGLSPIFVVI